MLLRRRHAGLDAILPLFETPPPAGGAPTGDPAPSGSGTPPDGGQPAGGGQPTPEDRSNWIPRNRFDEVNSELARLKKAEEDRQAEAAKKRGDFEELSKREKEAREAAEAKAVRVARRAAFIAKAAGKLTDAEAGYKLALADGMLEDLAVDDEGDADPKAVEKIVDKLTEKYEFLKQNDKGSGRDFGGPRGGNGAPTDPTSLKTANDMLRAGYATSGTRDRR